MKELEKTEGRKQRNHQKKGFLAEKKKRKHNEAVARAVRRIMTFEEALKKAKKKGEAQARLNHAQYALQTIRGGTPHEVLAKQFGIMAAKPAEPAK